MTLDELYTILSKVLPTTYLAWPEGEAPSLPWIAIVQTGTDNFGADGIAYGIINDIDVELYTKTKDPVTEGLVEKALTDTGVFWQKTETYIEAEKCLEIIYSLEV